MPNSRDVIVDLLNAGRSVEALAYLHSCLPGMGEAAANNYRGVALQQAGKLQEAAEAYRQSAQESLSDLLSCWNNLAGVCYHMENYGEAAAVVESLRHYHSLDADLLALHVLSLIELGKHDEAEKVARQFLTDLPRSLPGTRWLIHTACRNRKYLEALILAAEIPPSEWDRGGLANELLDSLSELDLGDVAQEIFPIAYGPETHCLDRPETCATAAMIAISRRDYEGARSIYTAGRERGYRGASSTLNLSLMELAAGKYDTGWLHGLARAETTGYHQLLLPDSVPRWAGEPVAGKTLIVSSEQGFGDMVQFLRFIPALEGLGARVVFAAYPDIVALLRNDPRAAVTSLKPLSIDEIDYYTLFFDLPHFLGIKCPADVPCAVPYLYANPEKTLRWRDFLAAFPGMKVGLAWAGNPDFKDDHYRSASINIFSPLSGLPGVTFFGLQKGVGVREARCPPEGLNYVWLGDQFSNFEDTAAAIDNLDLVISTDTAIVHVAAALGKPVWLLLSRRSSDFRWMNFDGRNVWYPNVSVYRQEIDDDWLCLVRDRVGPTLAQGVRASLTADAAQWRTTALALAGGQAGWEATNWTAWGNSVLADDGSREAIAWLAGQIGEQDVLPALKALQAAYETAGQTPLPDLSVALGRQLLKAEDPDGGVRLLDSVAQQFGDVAVGRRGFVDWGWQLYRQEDLEQALAIWQRGAAAFPRDGHLHYLQGTACQRQRRNKLALDHFQRAIDCFPRHVKALTAIARVKREENLSEAAAAAQRAVMSKCHDVESWNTVVLLLHDRGMYWLAERVLLAKGDLENNAFSQSLRVRQLAMLGRDQEATEFLESVTLQSSKQPSAQQQEMLAEAYGVCGQRDQEAALLGKMSAAQPESRELLFRLGFSLLRRGNCRDGWKAYWRGLARKNAARFTEWEGQDLCEKSILVVQDQGQGDCIQFFVLLHELWAKQPKRLTLVVVRALVTLFKAQDVPFEVVNVEKFDWDDYRYDYQVDLMALPYLLDVDLLAPRHTQPTLIAAPGRVPGWQAILDADTQLKVGIVWSGGDLFKANYLRSTTLEDWRVLWEIEGISFYSLQKDIHSNEAAVFDRPLHNVAADCPTWLETLSIIASLDLVITTCTAVAHAAGSIDKPTWVVLSNEYVDFRWLEDRDDSPWYPSVRLIRRRRGEPWRDVFRRIADDLVTHYDRLSWRSAVTSDSSG